jgi:hypothetical protein
LDDIQRHVSHTDRNPLAEAHEEPEVTVPDALAAPTWAREVTGQFVARQRRDVPLDHGCIIYAHERPVELEDPGGAMPSLALWPRLAAIDEALADEEPLDRTREELE